jgi:hypothetical protein
MILRLTPNTCVSGQIRLHRLPRDKVEMSRACCVIVGFLIPLQLLPRIKLATNLRQTRDVSSLSATCSRRRRQTRDKSSTSSRQLVSRKSLQWNLESDKLETSRLCLEEVAVVEPGLLQPVAQGRVGERPRRQAGTRVPQGVAEKISV